MRYTTMRDATQERYLKALEYQNIQLRWEAEQQAFLVENQSLGVYNTAKFVQGFGKGVWNVAWEVGSIPADLGYTIWKCTDGWTACHTRMGEQFDPIATMWDDYYEVAESGYLTVTGQQTIGEHNAIAYDTFRRYTYGEIIDDLEAGNYYGSGEATGQLGGSAALVFTPIKYLPKIPKLPARFKLPAATAEAARALEAARAAEAARALEAARAAEAARALEAARVGETPVWTSWQNYPKVIVDGREYAQVGDRLYTKHAVDRLQPSGLGAPAGATGPGRSISPTFVDYVLQSTEGVPVVGPLGQARLSFTSGTVEVITENGIVVTVITR